MPGAERIRTLPVRSEVAKRPQKLIELMVSAIESRNRWMDGAMPVEARKNPKSTATTAGPALIDPPLINTTRMIANSSTTDSEMATTDHTLRSVPLSRPGGATPHTPARTIVPPTRRPYAAGEASSATNLRARRVRHPPGGVNGPLPYGNSRHSFS
jgi:hypothetical protein